MDIQEEIDRNFDAFVALLPELMTTSAGLWALMRSGELEAIFDTAKDAQTAGEKLFPDGLFSIQRVTDEPVDLGWFSHAVPQRQL